MDTVYADVDIVGGLSRCHEDTRAMMLAAEPGFLARIGGSDTDIVIEYFGLLESVGPDRALDVIRAKFGIVERYNGYYDKDRDPAKIARFCTLMIDAYQACNQSLVVGSPLLTEFFPDSINPTFHVDTSKERDLFRRFFELIGLRQKPARFYPYPYVENLLRGEHTLFRTFSEALPNKRVLAVTPFAESIKANFGRRHDFFRDYAYPEFALETYNTPITYDGLPADFYPDRDWFSTLERMKREISEREFDVALLSCGSYAMPLGLHIRDVLKRKAIYVGGCLQLFFGVSGRRYDNPWFVDQINVSAFIHPLERAHYLRHIEVAPGAAKEAFGAYF